MGDETLWMVGRFTPNEGYRPKGFVETEEEAEIWVRKNSENGKIKRKESAGDKIIADADSTIYRAEARKLKRL